MASAYKAYVFLLFLFAGSHTVSASNFEANLFTTYKDSVVYIESEGYLYSGEIERMVGSGFIITTDGVVLTNNHVTFAEKNNYKTITYKVKIGAQKKGNYREAKLVDVDTANDLALLRISNFALEKPIPISDSMNAMQGDSVAVLGFQLSFDLSISPGLISTIDGPNRWITTAPINMGSSGAPVFSANGHAIGIVSSGVVISHTEGMGDVPIEGIKFFVPSSAFLSLLAKRNKLTLAQIPATLPDSASSAILARYTQTYHLNLDSDALTKARSAYTSNSWRSYVKSAKFSNLSIYSAIQNSSSGIKEIEAAPGYRFTSAAIKSLAGEKRSDFEATLTDDGTKVRIAYVFNPDAIVRPDIIKSLAIVAEQEMKPVAANK